MKRNSLLGKGLMRLAACALMVSLGVGAVWGQDVIQTPRLNPEFIKWRNKHKNSLPNSQADTNAQKRVRCVLTAKSESDAELLSLPEGLTPTMIDFSYLNSLNSMNVGSVSGALPTRHDPRPLTPVRHQDPQDTGIGTCWAQASVGSMETWLLLNGHGQNQFSVRNVVNREGWDSNSWHGGNFIRASAYLLRWNGPVWENDDPYTNRNGIVNYSFDSPAISPAYHVQQTRLVPARTGALDNDSLKKAILKYGGLYATIKLYSPYYDGKDITRLDHGSLRRNIGTVMQSGGLFQGDIYSNIVISAPHLTLDEAWEAAEIAGIADDIRAMPMGMQTLISEGHGGISGGQKQRLMIARAVAPKPKILMFDEATSALDNKTQKQVSEALDKMGCTRIVIAHRLSTIRHCDRILVLDDGKIIEEGSYEQLISRNGFFAELVKRQRLDIGQ